MLVFILFNAHSEEIECVFKNREDAEDMLNSFKGCKDRNIQIHKVIE